MPRPLRIAVVGFGPCGGTAAYLLADHGHDVTLFERAERLGPVGAGILLQPSGQIVLKRLGLLHEVAARAEPIDELHAVTDRGRIILKLPYEEVRPGCTAFGVARGVVFDAIHRAVLASGVNVRLGCDILETPLVPGGIAAVDARGERHGPFDFVVVAEGSRSRMRAASGLTRWEHEYAYGAIWLIGRCTAIRRKLYQVVRGSQRLVGVLPMGDGRCSLYWGVRRDEVAPTFAAPFSRWRDDVLRLCPEVEELFEGVSDFDGILYTTYRHAEMRSWHDERRIFLGDAAHPISPHMGQGTSLALWDAFAFARSAERSSNVDEIFGRYVESRRRIVRFYSWVSLALSPFFQSDGVIKAIGRDIALPLMPRLPILRRQMLLSMAGIKAGFLAGAMAMDDPGPADDGVSTSFDSLYATADA